MVKTVRQLLIEKVSQVAGIPVDILIPPDSRLGDYATNVAFVLAKKQNKKPSDVAEGLKSQLAHELTDIATIEVAPTGFLNFFLKPEFLQQQLTEMSNSTTYGSSQEGKGKTVIVEYSSPNIAKPMHIGHLRSTIIGDALANIHEALGYTVVRWNFLGDWGTQFGKLIAAYKKWGNEVALAKDPINEMLRLYVKFHEEMKTNPELEKEGQAEFKKLEDGDPENRKIWQEFKIESLKEFAKIYTQLGIDSEKMVNKSESDYESELQPIITQLKEKHKIKESEGALIFDLEKYNLPPGLLQKSDGATLYLTRDLASLGDRLKTYHPTKILYVVANQQALHFEQLFAIAQELYMTSANLVHVKFGMVLGEDGKKLATREGKVVALQEVLGKITELALETVKEKNPNLQNPQAVAYAVAIAALKYNDLKQHPYSDITFDWQAMLDLSGNSGPYLQYTYARLTNILTKAGSLKFKDLKFNMLTEAPERKLMSLLLSYPDAVAKCAELYTLNSLALYLYELAAAANHFYEVIRILEDDNADRKNARLTLIATVAQTLKSGLALLGIETLDRI